MKEMSEDRRRAGGEDFELTLARAVKAPPADPAFRRELKVRLLGGTEAMTQLRPKRAHRHQAGRVRRRAGVWAAAAAVAVIVFALVVRPGRTPTPPLAEFGPLPRPAAGMAPALGGAGGPGFQFEFTYRLDGPLAAGWPQFPAIATAYRRAPHHVSEGRLAGIAAKLGILRPVVREGWMDGEVLAAEAGPGGPAVRLYPNGYIHYERPYDYRPVPRAQLPPDTWAVQLAREWLTAMQMVPAGELGSGSVGSGDLDNGYLRVTFRPAQPGDLVTFIPFAHVTIGVDETIVGASVIWVAAEAESAYPLRSVAEAWRSVTEGRGVLEWELVEYTGPAGEDNLIAGTASATSVRLAWSLAFGADRVPYFVPVYAFSGEVEVPDKEGTVRLPFQVWASAAAAEHSPQ
ncbi:MAG: hypothetical protein AB1492_07030 [Bacillota bacterium]